jgi:predicted SAM-dependent methyltransferase
MDAHHPHFMPSTFDAVVGVSILHHLEWETALKAYFEILKPGGTMRFSEPNLLNPQIFLQKNIPILKRWAGDSPDEYAFTKWQIEECLNQAGFKSIMVTPVEFLHPATPSRLIPLISRLEKILESTPLRHIGGSLLIEAIRP